MLLIYDKLALKKNVSLQILLLLFSPPLLVSKYTSFWLLILFLLGLLLQLRFLFIPHRASLNTYYFPLTHKSLTTYHLKFPVVHELEW